VLASQGICSSSFLGCHGRDLIFLMITGVRNGCATSLPFDPEVVAQSLDGLDHGGLVHDRAVDDSLRWQRLETEVDQLNGPWRFSLSWTTFTELEPISRPMQFSWHRGRSLDVTFISLSSPTWWGIYGKSQKTFPSHSHRSLASQVERSARCDRRRCQFVAITVCVVVFACPCGSDPATPDLVEESR